MQGLIRKILVLIILTSTGATLPAYAYSIKGKVLDSEGLGLPQASVRLLSAKDSTQLKAIVSKDDGSFTFPNINNGRYIMEASYVGFSKAYQSVRVKDANVTLPDFKLNDDAKSLGEITVTGVRTPIKVMQDTVEFAADAYKTTPNAVVEDLLKRLPGVEVGSDGKITANGKSVSKILVDGKEFFSDDPTVASKNLPVNMVDKLQVVDRKSDLARLTGVDDGEDETVINLTVKKGMKNGWFGTVEGGYGTDKRYKGNFNINRFWNDNQITFLGNINNINELGFSDGTAGRFRRFGGSNGITTSRNFGLNFNVGNKEIFRVGGNVMYSGSKRDTRQTSDRQYLFPDSVSYSNSERDAIDRGHNVRADFRVQWNPDSSNTFEFRPNFSFNQNKSNSHETGLISAGDALRSPVTETLNKDYTKGTSFEAGGRLIYNHKFSSKKGRALSLFVNYRFSNVREKSDSYSWNKFYSALLNDSIDLWDQYSNNRTWSNNIATRVTWTEPLGNPSKGNFLTFAYRFSYKWNNADKLTYDHPVEFPDGFGGEPVIGDELNYNKDLSNRFRNDYMDQDIRVGYKKVTSAINFEGGLSLVPQMSKSIDLEVAERSIPIRHTLNMAPYMRFRWKRSKSSSLNIDYRGRNSQPSMAQLQNVEDRSDPLRIVQGNPNLKPSFTHNLGVRFQDFNMNAQRSIMAFVNASTTQNSIVSFTEFDPSTGGQRTTYKNVNGVWNVMGMNMISLPLRNREFNFTNHLMLRYNRSIGFNNGLRNVSNSINANLSPGFSWRPDNAQFEIRPTYGIQYVKNSVRTSSNNTVHNYGGRFDATYYTPFGLVVGTDLQYTATSGYAAGYDSKVWMWNASLSYQFLSGRNATVTLRAYDLLGQRSNISRSVTANYIDDTRYNSLTRYFMLTLSYKFNTFKKGEQPNDRNQRGFGPGFGPGHGPGGGGRPQGPPPGM